MNNIPRIALVGRPNVGKSTLFNRFCRKKLAVVHNTPGVTRDWREAEAEIYGTPVIVIDTAGIEQGFAADTIQHKMREKSMQAIERADLILFMVDGRAGITPDDEVFARIARKSGKPVLPVVNKCEGKAGEDTMLEIYRLGLGEAYPVSAEHGDGMGGLMDYILDNLPEVENDEEFISDDEDEDEQEVFARVEEGDEDYSFVDKIDPEEEAELPLKMAIVGRPNAGKSTLVNALLKEDRVIVSPIPGATRDSISLDWEYANRKFRLVDTAGLRKKAKIHRNALEHHFAAESLRSIRLAQIVVLVIDATLSFDKQDLLIADHVISEGRALLVVLNKWDAVDDKDAALQAAKDRIMRSLSQLPDVSLITLSAINGKGLNKLMKAVLEVYTTWNARVATGPLNRWLRAQESYHPAPMSQGRPNRLRYITQIKTRPPTFALWVSRPKDLPDSYIRYITNGMRTDFKMTGVPIRLVLRTSKNPYHG